MSSFGILTKNAHLPVPVPPADGGTGTTAAFTQGSVVFAGSGGNYSQDNTNLNYDISTSKLGVKSLAHNTIGSTINYYVATTGSDSNDGFSASTPFLTIQRALDTVAGGLFSGTVQINIADGTYVENLTIYPMVNTQFDSQTGNPNTLILSGNETTPTNVQIKPASGTVITAEAVGTSIKLLGLNITSSSSSSTGIVASGCNVYIRNTQIDSVATFVTGLFYATVIHATSTTGLTWTASTSNGALINMSFYSSFQHNGGTLTLVAGSATTTMMSLGTYSQFTTGGGTISFTGTSGTTAYGIRALSSSNISLVGTFTFQNINGTPSANTYSSGAIMLVGRSSATLFSSSSYTFNTVTTPFFLSKDSMIECNGSVSPTYTSITGPYVLLDHTCNVDSTNLVGVPATGWSWNASRNPGVINQVSDAFRAGTGTTAANNLSLPNDGNIIHVSGTTQINLINNYPIFYPWYSLIFDNSLTVKDNQAPSGTYKAILLNGSTDFVAGTNSTLGIVYDTTNGNWVEVSRTSR